MIIIIIILLCEGAPLARQLLGEAAAAPGEAQPYQYYYHDYYY